MAWKQVVPSTLESDCTVRSVPHLVGKASVIFFPPRCPCDFGDGQKLDAIVNSLPEVISQIHMTAQKQQEILKSQHDLCFSFCLVNL